MNRMNRLLFDPVLLQNHTIKDLLWMLLNFIFPEHLKQLVIMPILSPVHAPGTHCPYPFVRHQPRGGGTRI